MARGLVGFGICASLVIHVLDQVTDVFAATLFYFEGNYWGAGVTLGLVLLPGLCIGVTELRHFCSRGNSSLVKSLAYAFLSPLWAIILHLYSCCDDRYLETAFFFKTMEGFLEAGPQLALQLSLLLQGSTSQSKQILWERHIGHYPAASLPPDSLSSLSNETIILDQEQLSTITAAGLNAFGNDVNGTDLFNAAGDVTAVNLEPGSLRIFGRVYNEDARYWFGWVHLFSVFMSFVSIFCTSIMYNEHRPRPAPILNGGGGVEQEVGRVEDVLRCDSKACGKVFFGIPFFLSTLVYRILAVSLLITFLQMWTGVVLFLLFFLNVLTSLFIGDNFFRAIAYGLWSLFVPAGYNTDPTAFLGYTKLPLVSGDDDLEDGVNDDGGFTANTRSSDSEGEGELQQRAGRQRQRRHDQLPPQQQLPTEKEAARSQVRTKYFLTMHVLSSILVLGPSIGVMYGLIYSRPEAYLPLSIIPSTILSTLLLPLMGLSLGVAVLTVRPYHRIDCSGGEVPKGNIIV